MTYSEWENSVLERAIGHWGQEAQLIKCVEELAELQAAIARLINYTNGKGGDGREILENLEKERADVTCMLAQLDIILGDNSETDEEVIRSLAKRLGMPVPVAFDNPAWLEAFDRLGPAEEEACEACMVHLD